MESEDLKDKDKDKDKLHYFGYKKILGLIIGNNKKRSLEARADAFSRLKKLEIKKTKTSFKSSIPGGVSFFIFQLL